MDEFTICEKINNYITVQEQFLDKSPFQKKLSVVECIKKDLDIDTYEKYRPLIFSIIDFIVAVGRGRQKIQIFPKPKY